MVALRVSQMEFHGRMMGPRPGFAPGMGGPMGAPPRGFMPQMGGPRPMIHGRPGMMPPPMGGGAPFIGGPRGPMGFDGGRGGRGGGRGRGGRGGFGSQRKGIAFRPPPDDEGPLSEEEKRARTVFVSKLHRACTSAAVKDFFGQVGYVVNVSMMIDFATGQSRGMAHVRMANKEGAEAALALNGTLFAGREVAVAPFKDKKEREPPADKAAAKEAPAAREAQGGAEGGKPKVRKWVRPGSGLPGDPLLEEKKEEGEIVAEAVAKAAAQQN
ncbi:unnamed protein product [Pedinophyceae sp. YPF-701]|nr:unnamed protein product [Pedinophyceae sp. YPF-701]